MEIRKAELKDIETLIEFNINCAFESENLQLNPSTIRQGVTYLLENPSKGNYYIAEIDGEAAGCLMITLQWVDWKASFIAYIQSVYTKQQYRGRGVFKALYNHVRNMFCLSSLSLRLYADDENARALEVYRKVGMETTPYIILETDFGFK